MDTNEIIKCLIENRIATANEIIGCSTDDIRALEKSIGTSLPKKYQEFLLAAGHSAGRLFQGTDIFYRNLMGLKDDAISLLNENNEKFTLPIDTFVISMHQGYEFNYFKLTEGDDPPIYQYVEGGGPPMVAWASFTNFLNDSINAHTAPTRSGMH